MIDLIQLAEGYFGIMLMLNLPADSSQLAVGSKMWDDNKETKQ